MKLIFMRLFYGEKQKTVLFDRVKYRGSFVNWKGGCKIRLVRNLDNLQWIEGIDKKRIKER